MPFLRSGNSPSRAYDDDFKNKVFLEWMRLGRPAATGLYNMMSPDISPKPALHTLKNWIYGKGEDDERAFLYHGNKIDDQIKQRLEEEMVASKVEMFKRHAEIGRKLQSLSLKFLEEEGVDWTTASAVRALVEGVRIEMQSMGIPDMLKRISDMNDEDILDQIKELTANSPVQIEVIDE